VDKIEYYKDLLSSTSIRGRYAYSLLCLENAFRAEHVDLRDYQLLNVLWEFTNTTRLDLWEQEVRDIAPCCIMDESVVASEFIGGEQHVEKYLQFYRRLPHGL